jgi:hypothetical protein
MRTVMTRPASSLIARSRRLGSAVRIPPSSAAMRNKVAGISIAAPVP